MGTNGVQASGLSLSKLQNLKTLLTNDALLKEPGEFCTLRMALKDDDHEYRLVIFEGNLLSIEQEAPHIAKPVDFTIVLSSEAWAKYLQNVPHPDYADLLCMFTAKLGDITGNTELFWQHLEFITGLMRLLGHRNQLLPEHAAKAEKPLPSGYVEEVTGHYVHIELDGHTYRTFFEENGPKDAVAIVCLHAANIDARAWRHQLQDSDWTSKYRVIAFDMPWHGRSLPPQELLRTEYLLTNDFYRRFVGAFCDAVKLDRPIVLGCSMGGYIMFYMGYYDPGKYRGLISAAGRDYEPRRWGLERMIRSPTISFDRFITTVTRGFMAPQDPIGCVDEVSFLYETGSPQALRGDLHFAARDCDARPFMGKIDTKATPFYVLGGEYDWSCTEAQTDEIKSRMPGAVVVRMMGIGHHPADENPDVFKKYVLPLIEDCIQKSAK